MTTCLICDSENVTDLNKIKEYWHCENCGVAWRKKFVKAAYKDDYYKASSSVASVIFNPILDFFYFWRTKYSRQNPKGVWIDVGAGDGRFISKVISKRKIGVEGSEAARSMMLKKDIEVLSDAQFLKKKNLKADVVSFWHVLEHLRDPKKFLFAARGNLKKKGELIIAIPNIDSFEFMFFRRDWFHLEPSLHLWHFSPKSLKIFLNKCGFKIVRIDYFSIEHHFTGLLQSFINKTSSSKNSLHKLVKSVRQKNSPQVKTADILLNVFWITLGLPIVFAVWLFASLTKRPGTFVVVASKIHFQNTFS